MERIYVLEVPPDANIPALARQYAADPAVEYAEPNYIVRATMIPNDPYFSSRGSWNQKYDDLWGLKLIEADKAWAISQGEDVVVAVIDTGVDYLHEDLTEDANGNGLLDPGEDQNGNGLLDSNIWVNKGEIPGNGKDDDGNGYIDDVRGWDFVGSDSRRPAPDNDPFDDDGHGTHVAGTIAALGNNGRGIIGVAPKAKIMPIKGLDAAGNGRVDGLAQCIRYAADNGARVINNSWGGLGISRTLTDTFRYAYSQGCVSVAAAGNENSDASYYEPAGIGTVIAVSASNQNDEKCDFSNYGLKIDVSAPGGDSASGDGPDDSYLGRNILSLRAKDTDMYADAGAEFIPKSDAAASYYRSRGTSMACPHVSGVAALIMSKFPSLSNEQVRQIIRFTADDRGTPGRDGEFGYGRVNANQAVKSGRLHISIDTPVQGSYIRGVKMVDITGGVFAQNFPIDAWMLSYAPREHLEQTTLISTSSSPIENGVLGRWDVSRLVDAEYRLLLTVSYKMFDERQGRYLFKQYTASTDIVIDNVNNPATITIEDVNSPGINLLAQDSQRVLIPRSNRPHYYLISLADPLDERSYWGPLELTANTLPPGGQLVGAFGAQFLAYTPNVAGTFRTAFTIRDGQADISKEIFFSTVTMTPTPLSTDHDSMLPKIWGDNVVWVGNNGINRYQISTGQTTTIAPGVSTYGLEIHGDMVAWSDGGKTYAYNLATGSRQEIQADAGTVFSLHNNRIVWADSKIRVFDINSGSFLPLVFADEAVRSWPVLYGDHIYFKKKIGDNDVVSVYDLPRQEERQLSWRGDPIFNFAVSGDKLAWEQFTAESQYDIFVFDLAGGEVLKRVSALNGQRFPSISGDKMVWQDSRNFGRLDDRVYVYDFTERQEYMLTPDFEPNRDSVESFPRIFNNTVVWSHTKDTFGDFGRRTIVNDVYVTRLSYAPYLTSVTTEPSVGNTTRLILAGRNFGERQETSKVLLGSSPVATISKWTDTQIICTVPHAVYGEAKVVTEGGESNGYELPSLPDLTILQFFVEPPARGEVNGSQFTATAGQALRFTVTLPNQGAADSPGQTLRIELDGVRFAEAAIPPLPQGQMYTWVIPKTWQATVGTHQVTATVDALGEVAETDETNNQRTLTLVVTPAPRFIPSRRLRRPVFRLPPARRSKVR